MPGTLFIVTAPSGADKTPLVSGLLAFVSLGSTWLACRLMRYTDGDDDE